ncbi:universal stress protein [Streptomyces sp. NPDC012510]|uniref:universal stress protein n=1 Tax=Streptomyces sp. NPDC012510 TaxID=3364838 RepID=UPI0036F0B49E
MSRTVTVGLDGSRESLAAAEWAAREARLRALPLRLVNVWEPVPEPMGRAPMLGAPTSGALAATSGRRGEQDGPGRGAPGGTGAGKTLTDAAERIRLRHPGVDVGVEQLTGRASEALVDAAQGAELLVLGSRGLSGVAGFLLGSVGLHVVAHTERPVVLVRAGRGAGVRAADEYAPGPADSTVADSPAAEAPLRPVALGLDTAHPDPTLIRFAFEAAASRGTALRILHDWSPPAHSGLRERPGMDADLDADLGRVQAVALTEVLQPWRREFQGVEVVEESRRGKAVDHLLEASLEASLLVVGRRVRHSPLGARIGPVVHGVLHHARVPVAVVAHG